MKKLLTVCVASVLTLGLSVVASASDGPVAKSKLNKMGLGNVAQLSDDAGRQVRGKGDLRDIIDDIKDLVRDLSHLTIGHHHHHHH